MEMKCGVLQIIKLYVSHICAKEVLDLNLNLAVIDKISNFKEIAPNFTYSQKS